MPHFILVGHLTSTINHFVDEVDNQMAHEIFIVWCFV